MEKIKGWKMLGFNLIVSIFGVLEVTDVTSVIHDAKTAGAALIIIGVVNKILRFYTNTSVGKSK